MATLTELHNLLTGVTSGAGGLRAKVAKAGLDRATVIVGEETPSAARMAWAQNMLQNEPEHLVSELLNYVVLVNDSMSIAQILAASDASIQTAVNTAVDALYA